MSKERGAGGTGEKALRFLRDFNIAVGAVALGGAVLAPPVAAGALTAYSAFNFVQAGGYEGIRRWTRKK